MVRKNPKSTTTLNLQKIDDEIFMAFYFRPVNVLGLLLLLFDSDAES